MRRGALRAAATLAAVLIGALAASPALAEGEPGDVAWGIRPADGAHGTARDNFRFEAAPGATISDALVVTNRGSGELSLRVYGAGGELRDGHVELETSEAASAGLGAWLDVAPELELAPGGSVEVPFTVSVPADAAPGAHAGGLVTSSATAGTGDVVVDRRLAASIVVTVLDPGASSSGDASSPPLVALLALAGLAVVAGVVWFVVVRGRANP